MTHQTIREKFRQFMESKGHRWMPSSSLLPDDPSVLFTTAGMQQFKPYYTNPELAPAKNVVSIQKCVRTSDIDEVGDESHLTFFEMLGNFSFGGYWKKEAIQYAHEFITKEMGLKIDYVSIFGGEGLVPEDTESAEIWRSLDSKLVIKKSGRIDNFWGPTGDEGPCGPTTEIYVNGLEVWNIVFNQYYQKSNGVLEPLKTPGVDTGMGLERLTMVSQGVPTVFDTDLLAPIMALSPEWVDIHKRRIIADHARAVTLMISDGVLPSNKDQGYVLRRLLRRMIVQLRTFSTSEIYTPLVKTMEMFGLEQKNILLVVKTEANKFEKTLAHGQRELERLDAIDAESAFKLYESFGLPFEVIKDIGGEKVSGLTREAFDEKFKEHQEKSRTASAGMFKGGLADQSEIVIRYHTATHLLNAALRKVLGDHVIQKGSNINAERTRFDFSHPSKLTPEQLQQVQDLVNDWIEQDLLVVREEMPLTKARELGAMGVFDEKYSNIVSVYTIGDLNHPVSREFCGGPHVEHTGVIGKFNIIKEEAVSAGVRRIKANIS